MSTWIHWFQIARRSSSAKTSRSAQRVEQAPLDRFVTSLDSSPRQNSSVLEGWNCWKLQMLKIAVAQFMSQEMLEYLTCCRLRMIKSSWPGQYLWAKKEKYCGWGKGASTGALPTGRNRWSSFLKCGLIQSVLGFRLIELIRWSLNLMYLCWHLTFKL